MDLQCKSFVEYTLVPSLFKEYILSIKLNRREKVQNLFELYLDHLFQYSETKPQDFGDSQLQKLIVKRLFILLLIVLPSNQAYQQLKFILSLATMPSSFINLFERQFYEYLNYAQKDKAPYQEGFILVKLKRLSQGNSDIEKQQGMDMNLMRQSKMGKMLIEKRLFIQNLQQQMMQLQERLYFPIKTSQLYQAQKIKEQDQYIPLEIEDNYQQQSNIDFQMLQIGLQQVILNNQVQYLDYIQQKYQKLQTMNSTIYLHMFTIKLMRNLPQGLTQLIKDIFQLQTPNIKSQMLFIAAISRYTINQQIISVVFIILKKNSAVNPGIAVVARMFQEDMDQQTKVKMWEGMVSNPSILKYILNASIIKIPVMLLISALSCMNSSIKLLFKKFCNSPNINLRYKNINYRCMFEVLSQTLRRCNLTHMNYLIEAALLMIQKQFEKAIGFIIKYLLSYQIELNLVKVLYDLFEHQYYQKPSQEKLYPCVLIEQMLGQFKHLQKLQQIPQDMMKLIFNGVFLQKHLKRMQDRGKGQQKKRWIQRIRQRQMYMFKVQGNQKIIRQILLQIQL